MWAKKKIRKDDAKPNYGFGLNLYVLKAIPLKRCIFLSFDKKLAELRFTENIIDSDLITFYQYFDLRKIAFKFININVTNKAAFSYLRISELRLPKRKIKILLMFIRKGYRIYSKVTQENNYKRENNFFITYWS